MATDNWLDEVRSRGYEELLGLDNRCIHILSADDLANDIRRLLAAAEALERLVAAFEAEDAWPFSLELRAAARAARAALAEDGAE